jgi:hypothetical protein
VNYTTRELVRQRADGARIKFGPFASSHEAMGVALEEWDEFRERIHKNDIAGAKSEALDLAAVLIRFAEQEHFPRG